MNHKNQSNSRHASEQPAPDVQSDSCLSSKVWVESHGFDVVARQLINSGEKNYISVVLDTERGHIEVTARYVGNTPADKLPAHSLPAMPSCLPRAQADDLPGYLESDREWMENPNNLAALRWFIDNSDAIRVAIER